MNKSDFARTLDKFIKGAGSQDAAAKQLGISGAYLSDIRHGKREPGAKILTALGLKRVVGYEKTA